MSLEKHNERNSKEHSPHLGVAFAFCASKKPPREEIEPRVRFPRAVPQGTCVVPSENEKNTLGRTKPSKGVSQETCPALMKSFQPTLASNQRGILEAASRAFCVIIWLPFPHPDRAETGENDEDFIALCGKQLITL